ncbi:MAG: SAM-dependent methyltransferase [Clostridiales bacterium]|nr:SAM-dependent methyltransferase [Clostridiales bacterium]
MNNLSKRLLEISKLVSGEIVADVGCDHGKLSEYLLTHNICQKVFVSDISKSSLQKAIDLLTSKNLNFESICCDGLSKFNGIHIDECVISGMGGDEIVKIISSSPITIEKYILSPQHNEIDVKKFMLKNGYRIVTDKIIKDKNKFYTICKFEYTNEVYNYDEFDLHFGKDNFHSNNYDFKEYLEYQINKYMSLLERVDETREKEINNYLNLIKIAKKRLECYE